MLDDRGDHVPAVPGPGGSPLELTALSRPRRIDCAVCFRPSGRPCDAEGFAAGRSWARSRPACSRHRLRSERADSPASYTDLIKAACGVALGLGMSSRALFPELLISAKKRVLARLRTVRARTRASLTTPRRSSKKRRLKVANCPARQRQPPRKPVRLHSANIADTPP